MRLQKQQGYGQAGDDGEKGQGKQRKAVDITIKTSDAIIETICDFIMLR